MNAVSLNLVRIIASLTALLGLSLPHSVAAEPQAGSRAQRPEPVDVASVALAQLLAHNDAFVRKHDARYFAPFSQHQHPRVTVVACADSRFHMTDISDNPDGDVFVVRNIGNQIDSSQGSVEFAMRHLRTPLLLILGHVGCGAVHAAMSDYSQESPALRRELDGLHLGMLKTPATGSPEERWRKHILSNVHQQVRYAITEYRSEVAAGQAVVVGAVYDFRDELSGGQGRLHIINVNGESDPSKFRATPLWQRIEKEQSRNPSAPASAESR